MTNDGWSKEWPTEKTVELVQQKIDNTWPKPTPNPITDPVAFVASLYPKVLGWDLGNSADETALVTGEVIDGKLHIQELYKGQDALNKIDALTNPLPPDTQRIENINFSDPIDCNDPKHYTLKTKKEYNNKVPTHDPYTNPNAHIYHECACGAILDPGTKSFAALNNAASNAGWKIRWGVEHYKAYCVKCGEDVE